MKYRPWIQCQVAFKKKKKTEREALCCADWNRQAGGGANDKQNPWHVTDSRAVQLFCDVDGVVRM